MQIEIGNGVFYVGDCFDVMPTLAPGSVDMVLADLPYGATRNKWDSVLPLPALWAEYWRLCKPDAPVLLTAALPFDKVLAVSQLDRFRYEWVWEKTAGTGFLNAKRSPLRCHEQILVFGREMSVYNPQMREGVTIKRVNASVADHGPNYGKARSIRAPYESAERYPRDVLKFPKDNRMKRQHPTQKPIALFEYLIRTYTNPGDTVLDNTAGSGTTAIAAERAGRRWICIERDEAYACTAVGRITSCT